MSILVCPKEGLGPINEKRAIDEIKKLNRFYGSAAIMQNDCLLIQPLLADEKEFRISVKVRASRPDLLTFDIV